MCLFEFDPNEFMLGAKLVYVICGCNGKRQHFIFFPPSLSMEYDFGWQTYTHKQWMLDIIKLQTIIEIARTNATDAIIELLTL